MKLVEADDSQKLERDRLTHEAWGKKLSVEAFVAREARLRSHRWAAKSMQTWLLMDGARVLSSCESFRMVSLQNASTRGVSFGIASVFTEPALRGKGYASQMMKQLNEVLAEQEPKLHAAILFSDVGAPLYERSGYTARPGNDRFLPASDDRERPRDVRPIYEADLAAELTSTPAPEQRFLIWPTPDQLDWHLERERIYAKALGRKRPESVGARSGHSTIFWSAYYASDVLTVLLMNIHAEADTMLLLAEAQRAAAQAGLPRVQLWESTAIGPWQSALSSVPAVPREGSLPMLRAFGTPAEPVHADDWNVLPRALWV